MAFQVLVTEIANEDLAGLVRYIARDNPAAAERFGLVLLGKLKLLRETSFARSYRAGARPAEFARDRSSSLPHRLSRARGRASRRGTALLARCAWQN